MGGQERWSVQAVSMATNYNEKKHTQGINEEVIEDFQNFIQGVYVFKIIRFHRFKEPK